MATFFDRHIRQDQEENFFDQFDSAEENAPRATGNFFDQFDEEGRDTSDTTEYENPVARGFAAGIDQLQGIGGGLAAFAGDVVGSDRLRDWGVDVYQQNMAEAAVNQNEQNFTDIDSVTDALGWAGYTLGNLAPMMAPSLLTGGVGGIAAKQGAKELAKRVIAEEVAKGATKKEAAKIAGEAVAKRVAAGSALGAGGASVGMSTGEIYGDTEDAGVAATHGVVAGAVDALPVVRVLDKLGLGKVAGDEIKKSVLKEAGKQSLFEGGTEAFQTLVEQHASHWVENNGESLLSNLGEANWNEIVEATAAGALGGGVMGAPAQMYQNRQIGKREQAENERQRVIEEAKRRVREAGGSEVDELNAAAQADLSVDSYIDDVSVDDIRQNIQEDLVEADRDTSGDIGAVFVGPEQPFNAGPPRPAVEGEYQSAEALEQMRRRAAQEVRNPGGLLGQLSGNQLPPSDVVYGQPPEGMAERRQQAQEATRNAFEGEFPAPNNARADGKMDELSKTQDFKDGNEYVAKVQAVNNGTKTFEEAFSDRKPTAREEAAPKTTDGDQNAKTLTESTDTAKRMAGEGYYRAMSRGPLTMDQTKAMREFYSGDEGKAALEQVAAENEGGSPGQFMDAVIAKSGVVSTIEAEKESGEAETFAPTLTASGKPFKTEKSALASAKQKKVPNAKAVQVDGGWGYVTEKPEQDFTLTQKPEQDVAPTESNTNQENIPSGNNDLPPSDQETAAADQEPPSILTDAPAKAKTRIARERGLKKGSPGYKDAVEAAYDEEYERALASLPFEEYQRQEPDQPEAVQRQTWEALREEHSITETPNVPAGRPGRDTDLAPQQPDDQTGSQGAVGRDDGVRTGDSDTGAADASDVVGDPADLGATDADAALGVEPGVNSDILPSMANESGGDRSSTTPQPQERSDAPLFSEDNRLTNINKQGGVWQAIKNENPAIRDDSETVTVYRATVGDSIRNNDYVAINPDIAEGHLENLKDRGESGRIVSEEIPVGDLMMANDATEFVYSPRGTEEASSDSAESPQGAGEIGSEGPQDAALSAPVLAKSGKPFKGKGSAQLAAKRAGLENAEIVEVDGGFGYRAADSAPATGNETNNGSPDFFASSQSTLTDDATPRGVGRGTAKLAVDKFLKQYKGADDVNVKIFKNHKEAFGEEAPFRTKGGYDPRTDTLYLFAEELDSVADLGETLRHEILVHKGLGMVEPAQLKRLLNTFYSSAKDSPELAQIVDEVERVENGRSDRTKAEEILARIGQETLSLPGKVLNKLMLAIQRMLNSIGLGKVSARRQGKDLVYRIADAFAEGKRARRRDAETADDGMMYSRTDDTFTPPVEERISYDENYEKLGNKDRTVFQKAKAALRREVTPGGLLPNSVFKLKLSRDFKINGFEFDIANRLGHLDQEVKAAYGKSYDKLADSEKEKINAMLGGDLDESIPEPVRVEVHKMRAVIRGLSRAYAQQLEGQIAELEAAGDPEALQKAALLETINQNLDTYVHRSYRAFDDPDWPKKVPRDVYDNAVQFLESQYAGDGPVTDEVRGKVNRKIRLLLEEGTAFDSMEAFISESKLGAKDLSVLKKRQQIAPEIRALLGEYTDPKINFTKSVTKMARLVLNQRFLDRVREIGMGDFLFESENAPPEATRKIAGEASDTYSPLNGLYTYPEVEQAFRDALGKEKMADWFRMVVRLNGMVKYGKTVLSPTTAARNWMSAAFFAMGNGHFDFTQMKKSVSGLREYFTHRGEEGKTAYLRKLKNLGVVYDTPYAGEMMDLLADSRIEETLFSKGPMASVKRANDFAQKFYQYGDDFWKILGFENEKAMLMKYRDMSETEAEREAAERIRNTYPTYSLTGRFVQRLRRFPLAGTFVSFPAEIIRTSYHIVRYAAKDMREAPAMGARKIVGLGVVSGMIHALQAVSMAMTGMDDEEEEAFRQLAASWQKNSNLLSFGRDAKGDTRLLDMSFLDPYNYWKRPLNAALRGQPTDELMKEVAREVLSPFFGQDIAFQAITEAITNTKSSGGRVFNPDGPVDEQIADIGNHLRKALQPGALSNAERIVKAMSGEVSASGKPYTMRDEMAALAGFRMTTFDPKASLYYKAFEFQDKKRNASNILSSAARNPNDVSDDKLRSAYENALETRMEAYEDMTTLVNAALKSGLNKGEVFRALRNSGVSGEDARALLVGRVPRWKPPTQMMRNAQKKAEVLFDKETAAEFRRREQVIRDAAREALR